MPPITDRDRKLYRGFNAIERQMGSLRSGIDSVRRGQDELIRETPKGQDAELILIEAEVAPHEPAPPTGNPPLHLRIRTLMVELEALRGP